MVNMACASSVLEENVKKVFTAPVETAVISFVCDSLWLDTYVFCVFGLSGPSFSRLLWVKLAATDQSAVAGFLGTCLPLPSADSAAFIPGCCMATLQVLCG